MRFKTQREAREYTELGLENPRLKRVLECLEEFCELEWGKDILITSIYRTPEEHKALYASTPNPPASSVHCQWEGTDLRSSEFTPEQIQKMLTFLNLFTFRNGKQTAMHHKVSGNAYHFHIQVAKK